MKFYFNVNLILRTLFGKFCKMGIKNFQELSTYLKTPLKAFSILKL